MLTAASYCLASGNQLASRPIIFIVGNQTRNTGARLLCTSTVMLLFFLEMGQPPRKENCVPESLLTEDEQVVVVGLAVPQLWKSLQAAIPGRIGATAA